MVLQTISESLQRNCDSEKRHESSEGLRWTGIALRRQESEREHPKTAAPIQENSVHSKVPKFIHTIPSF